MRKFVYLVSVVCVQLLLLFAASPAANAHNRILGTSPSHNTILSEMPTEIVLTYNEKIMDVAGSNVVLLQDATGKTMHSAEPALAENTARVTTPATLATDSVYRVVWRVVSADGHPIEGSFNFGVGSVTQKDLALLAPGVSLAPDAQKLSPELEKKQQQNYLAKSKTQPEAAAVDAAAPDSTQVVLASVAVVLGCAIVITIILWWRRLQRQEKQKDENLNVF